MICHSRKCIFIHIPKSAGSSIENAIWGDDLSTRTAEHLWMGAVRLGHNKYQTGGLQHLLATQIRTEVGDEIFDSYYKFSFVRNPWAKAVSQYKYVKTRHDLRAMMSLPRWFTFGHYLKKLEINHDVHVQSMEQHRFIKDKTGNTLVDFIGRFENLEQDFRIVANKLNMPEQSLPHSNKSKLTKPYQAFYNKNQRRVISNIYQKDIELFEYEF